MPDFKRIYRIILVLLVLSSRKVGAQSASAGTSQMTFTTVLPLVFYSPETSLGLRFLLNEEEQVQLRCDIGLGGDQLGFYFTVNDAF